MSKNLVIVESPAKAKTIKKYLGKDFEVLASYGHVRDLIPKEGAVDTDHDFKMNYQVIEKNEKHVRAIATALKKADALYLATDPDREGEAISWHLYELLKDDNKIDGKPVYRVVFHEITKKAIRDAVANPRELSIQLINAQQARRALDYLVGFNLSPLLWKKLAPKLSAGRVQSPALRLIVEREAEIDAFNPREYWTIDAQLAKDSQEFSARLAEYKGEKVEQFSFEDEKTALAADKAVKDTAQGTLTVSKIEKKQRKRNPTAPFTTSTLQQEASRKLGFTAQRTMRTAQRLYEGVNTGDGEIGLITYMRTDSVTLAADAITELRALIKDRYGADNLPDEAPTFKTKAKNAQEAHEAIRPTSAVITPESIKQYMETDQFKLYDLIWKRTVACQMIHALFDTVSADLVTDDASLARFRANGSVLVKPGFLAVYAEGQDDSVSDDRDKRLPPMAEGETIEVLAVLPEQHFTEPPPRFSEASLVKTLEEYGIGRPSTYASIISTLRDREYVDMDKRRFIPMEMGKVVITFLTKHFPQYVDYDFTAQLEDALDEVSRGEKEWVPLMREFWVPFHKLVKEKENLTRSEVAQARELGTDPKSGRPVSIRMGRYGPFVQIGTRDDEDKPKFAGLRPGQKMDAIELDEALELFKLPRKLGATEEGEPVSASIGRFGPYIKYGDKFVSMRDDDPYTVALPRALELIAEKKLADANRLILDFEDEGIQVLNGRYGPYITDKEKNARVPKDREPKTLTLEECVELLAAAPVRRKKGSKKKAAQKKKTTAKNTAKKKTKKKAKKKTRKKAKKKARKKAATKKSAASQADADPF